MTYSTMVHGQLTANFKTRPSCQPWILNPLPLPPSACLPHRCGYYDPQGRIQELLNLLGRRLKLLRPWWQFQKGERLVLHLLMIHFMSSSSLKAGVAPGSGVSPEVLFADSNSRIKHYNSTPLSGVAGEPSGGWRGITHCWLRLKF